jgi:CDGSH-type Zn-finger protein
MNDTLKPALESTETIAKEPIEVMVTAGKTYWWCACGRSKTQPFCDGSHKGTAFTPLRYQAAESGAKWFCVCKRTQNAPFCDGSHAESIG